MNQKIAIIIGAGPAGLTAAYELLEKTDIIPIIYEMSDKVGGISKTINYNDNLIDIGGHRFFSKSEKIIDWWLNIFPIQSYPAKDDMLLNRDFNQYIGDLNLFSENSSDSDPEKRDKVMLARNRVSRILFLKHFFDYPISLNLNTMVNLGFKTTFLIFISYIYSFLFPITEEKSLEDFFINRFGKKLYLTFFKDYTEKVWGIPCNEINAEWGEQRIKNLSIYKTISHYLKKKINKNKVNKITETSLIERFMYPKLGPGQIWEETAKIIENKGGKIFLNHEVIGMDLKDDVILKIKFKNNNSNIIGIQKGDYFFSTMPIKNLINSMGSKVPEEVIKISNGLVYRDFITVGLLLNELKIKNDSDIKTLNNIIPDNWIYIQEKNVNLGRIQVFNNWSPYLVKDDDKIWLGLEYFCNEGDILWNKSDEEMLDFAVKELLNIEFINSKNDVLDGTVIKVEKAYPAYFGSYGQFDIIRDYIDNFENLFLIGRNGMHRYNNMDHSMLTAIKAVENIINEEPSKNNIWLVNTEEEYHE